MPPKKDSSLFRVFKVIMFTRLFIGFYYEDLIKYKRIEWFIKLCFIVTALAFSVIYYITDESLSPLVKIGFISEYMIAVTVSCLINACPISYFSSVAAHCEASKTHTTVLVAVWCASICTNLGLIFNIAKAFTYCINFTTVCKREPMGVLMTMVLTSCTEVAKVPKIISCVLLFCDIKSLQVIIKVFGFQVDGNNHVDYIQIYEDIYKGFQKIENKIKCLICLDLMFLLPSLAAAVSENIAYMKSGKEWNFDETVRMTTVAWNLVLNLFPMLTFEAVAEIQEKIIVYVLDRRLASSDEGVRKSARKLATYMTERPLRYTLWYTVPLDMQFVIGIISFFATYTVAALQMSLATNN